MVREKRFLVDEQTSPLHRIMWVYNVDEPEKRTFENNISTFHIGNGYLLSVAHNLRIQAGYFRSINEDYYEREVLIKLDGFQKNFMDQCFFTDSYCKKRYLNTTDPTHLQNITNILKQKRFDTRWVALAQKNICTPFLIIQFKTGAYYGRTDLNKYFRPERQFFEKELNKHSFLLETELVHAFYDADIALYRIINTPKEVIDAIPAIEPSYVFHEDNANPLYCLQSSPSGPAGRLLNEASIEGVLDHFNIFQDEIGGNYTFEGLRYLIKGYFRFGSSGAPYICFDPPSGKYKANAIQSEASGIQLSIKNDREGNYQYINAIASPLHIIKDELQKYIEG